MIRALRSWLRSVPSRITGSHVELEAEHFTKLHSAARFPMSDSLKAAYGRKGVRIEDTPETCGWPKRRELPDEDFVA